MAVDNNTYPDYAKKCSDQVNMHVLGMGNSAVDKWVAIRLSDGGSDGKLYDKKADAVRHQLHETQCCYVCVPPTGMSPRQAKNFMDFNRMLYDQGMRLQDPDREVIQPMNLR